MLAPTLLRLGKWGVLLRLILFGVGPAANGLGQSYASDPLAFDVSHQRIVARFGDSDVAVHFTVTNRSHSVVVIHDIVPSCGCSVAQFPAKPWSLPAGASGRFSVVTDVRGKRGSLLKTVIVQSSVGARQLTYQVDIQESVTPAERALNQARAVAEVKLGQIGTRTERRGRAGDDHHSHRVVGVGVGQDPRETPRHVGRQRVAGAR